MEGWLSQVSLRRAHFREGSKEGRDAKPCEREQGREGIPERTERGGGEEIEDEVAAVNDPC